MKKKYWKYILKSLKNDASRIITITSIVGLGIGFLVGLLSTTPDLFASMDSYYDKANFADINIRSTVGFDKDTDTQLSEIDGIESISLTYEEEQYINIGSSKILAKKTYRPISDQNDYPDHLTLEEGRWPENINECLMLVHNDSLANYNIDQKVEFKDIFGNNKYAKIVGTVRDPNYITYQSEQSYLTGGTIKAYVYFDIAQMEEDPPMYTNAYIKLKHTNGMDSFGDDYDKYVENKISEIYSAGKDILDKRVKNLKNDIMPIAEEFAKNQIREDLKEIGILTDEQIEQLIVEISETEAFKTFVSEKADEMVAKQLEGMKPTWYVLNRDAVRSAYVFKTDALKVQTISMIFPPFFFLIALLVCMSSISRIITKDRQIIGTFKALGFTKGRIALKYLLYGIGSSLLGSIIGVAIGLFVIPWALMSVYSTIYYFQSMQFLFTSGYVIGFTILMVGIITAVVLGVVYTNLREPAAKLMQGIRSPKAGKKILIEKVPGIWNHLKFKYKSSLRNIFRFKKNLFMMIIGVGGCAGLLLTGFGIKDSFSVVSNDQYERIIMYDAVVTTDKAGADPNLIFDESMETASVTYLHGTVHGEDDINVEIFGADSEIKDYVGFYKTDGSELNFNVNSVIISEQLANMMGIKIRQQQFLQVTTDMGTITLLVNGICQNYVSNFIYLGEEAFNSAFERRVSEENNNAFLVRIPHSDDVQIKDKLDKLTSKESVRAVIPTSETRETYDDIVSNLGMIVGLITILSGALAAIVIYNLTDININERIREIATLRVCGYTRQEVLMYILREILIMSLVGILVGLGIGVFLHWFIIVNISSIGINFSLTIHWSSYLITFAIATAFVLAISFCFYPKIKKVNMTESLKSVD